MLNKYDTLYYVTKIYLYIECRNFFSRPDPILRISGWRNFGTNFTIFVGERVNQMGKCGVFLVEMSNQI